MFATPTSYCVTPGGQATPFGRLPSRASSLLRDVKRRSLRSYRSKEETIPQQLCLRSYTSKEDRLPELHNPGALLK